MYWSLMCLYLSSFLQDHLEYLIPDARNIVYSVPVNLAVGVYRKGCDHHRESPYPSLCKFDYPRVILWPHGFQLKGFPVGPSVGNLLSSRIHIFQSGYVTNHHDQNKGTPIYIVESNPQMWCRDLRTTTSVSHLPYI